MNVGNLYQLKWSILLGHLVKHVRILLLQINWHDVAGVVNLV